MGSRPLAQKNEAHVWLCWHFFFLGTTCVGFFHGWSPPSRFRYHRPRIASNGNQLGPVSWSIEHIAFVSYRIGILPRRHVQSILKLSAQIPTCRIHNMMCRFRDFASPYAQSRHTTPKGTHHNKTDSLGVRLIWVLLASRSAIATATRTWREQQKNEGCARFATKFRPSTVK